MTSPDFYYSQSMQAGYGLFEHAGYQGAGAPGDAKRP
jgi:hypothetical protein